MTEVVQVEKVTTASPPPPTPNPEEDYHRRSQSCCRACQGDDPKPLSKIMRRLIRMGTTTSAAGCVLLTDAVLVTTPSARVPTFPPM